MLQYNLTLWSGFDTFGACVLRILNFSCEHIGEIAHAFKVVLQFIFMNATGKLSKVFSC